MFYFSFGWNVSNLSYFILNFQYKNSLFLHSLFQIDAMLHQNHSSSPTTRNREHRESKRYILFLKALEGMLIKNNPLAQEYEYLNMP